MITRFLVSLDEGNIAFFLIDFTLNDFRNINHSQERKDI